VVFEVLSEGTSRTDRIEKLREYNLTQFIERYVILEPDFIAATILLRRSAGMAAEVPLPGDTLRMPEIDVEVPMAEFYVGVDLTEQAPSQAE
jgi:hypothetical protein